MEQMARLSAATNMLLHVFALYRRVFNHEHRRMDHPCSSLLFNLVSFGGRKHRSRTLNEPILDFISLVIHNVNDVDIHARKCHCRPVSAILVYYRGVCSAAGPNCAFMGKLNWRCLCEYRYIEERLRRNGHDGVCCGPCLQFVAWSGTHDD